MWKLGAYFCGEVPEPPEGRLKLVHIQDIGRFFKRTTSNSAQLLSWFHFQTFGASRPCAISLLGIKRTKSEIGLERVDLSGLSESIQWLTALSGTGDWRVNGASLIGTGFIPAAGSSPVFVCPAPLRPSRGRKTPAR